MIASRIRNTTAVSRRSPAACGLAVATALVLCVASTAGNAPAGQAEAERPAPATISGPRQLLSMHGVDDSQFDQLEDGRPSDADESETLLKVMFWVRDFHLTDLEDWTDYAWNLAELAHNPGGNRGKLFRLQGRARRVETCKPPPEVVRRFDLPRYYRCEFLLDPDSQPAVIFTPTIPQAWKDRDSIDQRAGAFGLFLKLGSKDPDRPVPVFVVPRIAWYPRTILGNLGMDVGLLDDVRAETPPGGGDSEPSSPVSGGVEARRLTRRDRECFYQMLAAVGRAERRQLLVAADAKLERAGKKSFSVVPLFNEASKQHGRLVAISGTARRVMKIRLGSGDADIIQRLGIDHYYELAVFTADSQDNPLVFCVRRLPPGMPTGEGPHFAESVRVAGFFLKTWTYRVQRPDDGSTPSTDAKSRWQLAPLLIGREPVWYPRQDRPTNTLAGAVAAVLFVLAMLGIWLAVWRYNRGDKQFREITARALLPDSGKSLDELALDANGSPDFSGIDQMDYPPRDEPDEQPNQEGSV